MNQSSTPDAPVEYREVPGGKSRRYRVGRDGSAWSSPDGEDWTRLNPSPQRSGHLRIFLGKGNGSRYVHHLVLEAFVGPCLPGMMCRHLDGNPANNSLDNLAWGSAGENQADRVYHDHIGLPPSYKLPKRGRIEQALPMHLQARIWEMRSLEGMSYTSIAKSLDIHQSSVIKYVRIWTHSPELRAPAETAKV